MAHEAEQHKPFDVWAYEKCRECSHNRMMHMSSLPLTGKSSVEMSQCNDTSTNGGFCNCSEFMPPDNLEYIELLAKKKGLILSDEDKI